MMNWRTAEEGRTWGGGSSAEFGLDLGTRSAELLVAVELVAGDVGHDLFMVIPRQRSAPLRSLRRNIASPMMSSGPDRARGRRMDGGRKNSWPMRSISFADDGR